MTIKAFESVSKTILFVGFVAIGFSTNAWGQGSGSNDPAATPAATRVLSPKEELTGKLRSSMKNPADYAANLAEFLNKYPYDVQTTSYIYSLANVFKTEKNAETARNLILQFVKNTEQVPTSLKADIYRYSVNVLFNSKLYADAADLSQRTIDLLDESHYIDFRRKQFDQTQTEAFKKEIDRQRAEAIKQNPALAKQYEELDKMRKPPHFNLGRAKSDFIGLKTNAYNMLGKSVWERGKFVEAEKAYRDSLAVKATKESALGLARAAEKNGKEAETLKYATVAQLTGRLDAEEMNYFQAVYAKQHQGKTDGVEQYLDAEYKKTYRNPVKSERYKKTADRSDRTVLIEFVTGQACIPCIPYDYTFEKALEDYSPKDIALVVYHTHAPSMDPLSNNSADFRYKYYALNGAPSVMIDGKKFVHDGDYESTDGDDKIQAVADAVNASLRNNLEAPAEARLKLNAKRSGQQVSVSVDSDQFKTGSDDVTLHVALAENETSYSGGNGLRFHMMVVRALAGDNESKSFGYKVDPAKANKFEYTFDVDKIMAQNLAYYDIYPVERSKEWETTNRQKLPEGLTFRFTHKANLIDSNHLSVIAYLQDNKTKKILQSAQVNLAKK